MSTRLVLLSYCAAALVLVGCKGKGPIVEVKQKEPDFTVVSVPRATPKVVPKDSVVILKVGTPTPTFPPPTSTPIPEAPKKVVAQDTTGQDRPMQEAIAPVMPDQSTVTIRVKEEAIAKDDAPALVVLPKGPQLTQASRDLIYEFEVGGGRGYYNKLLKRPEWPGFASGVTIGIGYDCGYNTKAVILHDWTAEPEKERLAATAGIHGTPARSKAAALRDIIIEWELAEQVYDEVTVNKFWNLCKRTYPGYEHLRLNAQGAILSLTFNRGESVVGYRRRHMKEIARLCPKKDYEGMAEQFEEMIEIWAGTDIYKGMKRRRLAEANLMRTP